MNGSGHFGLAFLPLFVGILLGTHLEGGGAVEAADSAQPRCAFISATEFPIAGLVEAALLEAEQGDWLERNEIDRILAEQELAAALGAAEGATRVAIGRLLKADLLVLLRVEPAEPTRGPSGESPADRIELVVAETAGGMRILARSLPRTDDPAADAVKLRDLVHEAIVRYRQEIRRVYAVPPFVSRDLGHRNDHLMSVYTQLVERFLLSQPGVLVVEMEEAEAISREIALAGPTDRVERPLPIYLLGEYRHEGQGDEKQITIALKARQGDQILSESTQSMPPSEAPVYLRQAAIRLLGSAESRPAKFDPHAEARQLAQRCTEFLLFRDWQQALDMAEASLLLDPGQVEMREIAILAITRIVKGYEKETWFIPISSARKLSADDLRRRVDSHSRVLQLRSRSFNHLQRAMAGGHADQVSEATIQMAIGTRSSPYPSRVPAAVAGELWQQVDREREYALEMGCRYAESGRWERCRIFVEAAFDRMMPSRAVEEKLRFLANYQRDMDSRVAGALCAPGGRVPSVETRYLWKKVLEREETDEYTRAMIGRYMEISRLDMNDRERMSIRRRATEAAPLEKERSSPRLTFRRIDLFRMDSDGRGERINDLVNCLPLDDGSDLFFGRDGHIYHVAEPGSASLAWKPLRIKAYDPRASVACDGRYLWLVYHTESAYGQRLLVVEPESGRFWEIGREHGLPAVPDFVAEGSKPRPSPMLVAPTGHGEAIVTGSHGDAWIAHVRFDPGANHVVRVFHEAQTVHTHEAEATLAGNHDDSWQDSHIAFKPERLAVWEMPDAGKLVMIDRRIPDPHCPVIREHPLLVSAEDLSVTVMQPAWKNWGTFVRIQTMDPPGPYFFTSRGEKIDLMYREHPEREPVRLFSDVKQGRILVIGDTIHIVGRIWQKGSLSKRRLESLGDTPWQLFRLRTSDDGAVLTRRRFFLRHVARSHHYGVLTAYDGAGPRTDTKMVQVVFDGTGSSLDALDPAEEATPAPVALPAKTGKMTSRPDPQQLWPPAGKSADGRWIPGITDLAYSPGGEWIVTTQFLKDNCVRLWDGRNGRIVAGLLDRDGGMDRVDFSPSGRYFATMARDGAVIVWSTESREPYRQFQGQRAYTCQVAISWNDRFVIGAPYREDSYIWDLLSGKRVQTVFCAQDTIHWLAFSKDNRHLLADGGEQFNFGLRTWDIEAGRLSSRALTPYRVGGFLPDGTLLALSESRAGTDALIAWDYRNNTYRKIWAHALGRPVAVSADGRRVALVNLSGVSVWDLATQKRLVSHPEHMAGRWVFSPDGKWLVSGNGKLVRIAIPE